MATYAPTGEYFEDLETMIEACRATNVPIYLESEPGTGKTEYIASLVARHREREPEKKIVFITLILGSMEASDVAGLPARVDKEDKDGNIVSVVKNSVYDWVIDALESDYAYIFCDEISSARPSVQAAALTMIQSRKIPNGPYLHDGCFFIAAGNDEETAADGQAMTPPMANRFLHHNFAPTPESWVEGAISAWGKENISENEREWRNYVVAFIKTYPAQLHHLPTDNETDSENSAWPSRRSWENAIRVLGATNYKIGDSKAEPIIRGLVGIAASHQFVNWARNRNIPSALDVIENPKLVDWANEEPGIVFAVLGSIVALKIEDDPKTVEKFLNIVGLSGREDLGAPFIYRVTRQFARKGLGMPVDLAKTYKDILVNSGIN